MADVTFLKERVRVVPYQTEFKRCSDLTFFGFLINFKLSHSVVSARLKVDFFLFNLAYCFIVKSCQKWPQNTSWQVLKSFIWELVYLIACLCVYLRCYSVFVLTHFVIVKPTCIGLIPPNLLELVKKNNSSGDFRLVGQVTRSTFCFYTLHKLTFVI